jgi:adenine-specific DNA-methyltransferase
MRIEVMSASPADANPRLRDAMISERVHHPRRHSAQKTESYVYSQLIPYIGNKRKLLPLIGEAIDATGVRNGTFVDMFTGSTVVARFAKTLGLSVLANDWEPYSFEIAQGTVALNQRPPFDRLGGAAAVFDALNSVASVDGYISRHLCPEDDENPNVANERMFFTRANGNRIDAMRELVHEWDAGGLITSDERAYIIAAMVYSVSYASNTSGVFKGFHNGWGGQTGTALYRIRGELSLREPVLLDNGRVNRATREDAGLLAPKLCDVLGEVPDIVYLDPPYNQHPYGSNYHVLNTVALWDKPALNPKILVDGKPQNKAAIRTDWRTERRSAYNYANRAAAELERLVVSLPARWLMMSYSTDGNVELEDVLRILGGRGSLRIFAKEYKRYRVSTPRMSPKSHNVEFVALVDTAGEPCTDQVEGLADAIRHQENTALTQRPLAQTGLF